MLTLNKIKTSIQNEEGFTLLEMLVTLMIVSLLSITIFGFSSQLRNIRVLTAKTTERSGISALEGYLRRIIGNAKPLPLVEGGFSEPKYLIGTETSVKFVSEAKHGAFSKGLFDVAIYVDAQSSMLVQTLRFRRFNSAEKVEEIVIPVYEGAQNFQFFYADRDTDSGSVKWGRSWSSSLSLPLSIRLTGTISKENKVYNLDFVIPMNGKKALLN